MKTIDISLRFSDDLTRQDVFDYVSYHLGTTKGRSVGVTGSCVYRNPEGLQCAVGFLLKDEEVTPEINRIGVQPLIEMGKLPSRLIPHKMVLTSLQAFHDRSENWMNNRAPMKAMLRDRGLFLKLDVSILDLPELAWNKTRNAF